MNILSGYKTYLTAIAGIVAAIAAYSNGTTDIPSTVAAIWVAIQTINLRDALSKVNK
jgi:hypothetical protein